MYASSNLASPLHPISACLSSFAAHPNIPLVSLPPIHRDPRREQRPICGEYLSARSGRRAIYIYIYIIETTRCHPGIIRICRMGSTVCVVNRFRDRNIGRRDERSKEGRWKGCDDFCPHRTGSPSLTTFSDRLFISYSYFSYPILTKIILLLILMLERLLLIDRTHIVFDDSSNVINWSGILFSNS